MIIDMNSSLPSPLCITISRGLRCVEQTNPRLPATPHILLIVRTSAPKWPYAPSPLWYI